MWEWGNLFFLSTQGFFKKHLTTFHSYPSHPRLSTSYPHLSHPKTIKVKLSCQIKSSDNQPNSIVLKNCKTKELSTKYKTFPKLLSIFCFFCFFCSVLRDCSLLLTSDKLLAQCIILGGKHFFKLN